LGGNPILIIFSLTKKYEGDTISFLTERQLKGCIPLIPYGNQVDLMRGNCTVGDAQETGELVKPRAPKSGVIKSVYPFLQSP